MLLLFSPLLLGLGRVLPDVMERLFGVSGLIAAGNITRRAKRMVATGIILMFGIALCVLTSQGNFGYSDVLQKWVAGQNLGELTVTSVGADPLKPSAPLP